MKADNIVALIRNIIVSVRYKQWYKNFLLFVGLVFAQRLFDFTDIGKATLAFVYFCALSAGEYLVNDVLDYARDQKHPTKRLRPIAAGKLSRPLATLIALVLIVGALAASYLTLGLWFLAAALGYVLLIVLYSFWFKHVIIADVIIIALGFVIRAVAGCLAINVVISPWLIICTFLLALFLALGKRRHELTVLTHKAPSHRATLSEYTVPMLEHFLSITTAALIVSYLTYTFLTNDYYMMLTAPFATYGLLRYSLLVHQNTIGGEPELIMRDRPTLINLAVWGAVVVLVLYLRHP